MNGPVVLCRRLKVKWDSYADEVISSTDFTERLKPISFSRG